MGMIQPVSELISSAAQPPTAAAGADGPSKAQRPEAAPQEPPRRPVTDEYVPGEPREPSGRYWLGRDGDGQPRVYFDGPEKKASSGQAERCTASTDQVDREIERLKRKREELGRQIGAQTDEVRIRELEQKLAQVENELSQKDNDAYRRQHTVFS